MDWESDYLELFEWAPIACLQIDSEAKVRAANLAACRLFEYLQEQITLLSLFDLIAPEEREISRKDFMERLNGAINPGPFQRRYVSASGKTIIGEVYFSRILASDGFAGGFRVAIIDLTLHRLTDALHREVLRSATDAIVVMNEDGRIVEFNPAAERIFNYHRAEIIGRKLSETLIPRRLRTSHRAAFRHYLQTGEETVTDAGRLESFAIRADGREFPIELCVTRVNVPEQTLFAGFVRDISARINAGAHTTRLIDELDLHRVRWETILRQLPGGVLIADAQGHVVLTNDWMQKLMKRPFPDLESSALGGEMKGWGSADGSPYPVERWPPLRCLRTGEPVIREEMIFEIDEQVQAHMEVSASPILDRHGRLIAVGCMFFDVTAQRHSEKLSRISEARYRDVFERDIAANFILTRRLGLLACNTAAVALFGYESKREIFADAAAGQFPAPTDRTAILARARHPVACENRFMRLHRRDRKPLLVMGTLRGAFDGENRLIEIHGHFVDVTGRRRAEKKIFSLSRQLVSVQNEERRRLSHDLHDSTGQNLSALSMNLGLIESALQQSPARAAAYIEDSKELVQSCIRDIRTVSYTLHPPLLDELGLSAALRWFIEGFAKRSSIQVELEVAQDLGRLSTLVEISLFRIVQEALTNVHRHSGSKTAIVRISRNTAELTLIVADQGCGILASDACANAGAGIGLASIRQQLSFVNGFLELLPGRGTTLKATIPVKALRPS
jgi:PAS domain S-box-containing protein